ncbi:MAG: ABC transporter ATP-binding protein [Desulfofustis sp.]|jgi:putative ABC transport system ATP-binding protein|nr:ABC transporter ATP-binding protein [Desulfofustis sp.]
MLSAQNISKSFITDNKVVSVLKNISVAIEEGEFVSIVGRSGSGKTTLLNVMSTLVRPDSGELHYGEENLSALPEKRLNKLRQSDFSAIFQFHHLLPYLTVLENTLLPFMQSVRPVKKSAMEKARGCLERVGLADKADRLPGNLSGGEQQRVAIARALVKSSKVLFADEPTGSLDKGTGEKIMGLLSELHNDGLTVVMVTHDPVYAGMAARSVYLEDGVIV